MHLRYKRLLAAVCVEVVAAISLIIYGSLALVAVAVLYWIDLLLFVIRVLGQRLVARPTGELSSPRRLPTFRLLRHKRGTLTLSERVPPITLGNVSTAVGPSLVILVSALTTGAVLINVVPAAFWANPATPVVLVAGVAASTVKSWLLFGAFVAAGHHETEPATAIRPWKRLLLAGVYAVVLLILSDATVQFLADSDPASARITPMVFAALLIVLRLAYSVVASQSRSDGIVSRLFSAVFGEPAVVNLTPPPTPSAVPVATARPTRRSVLAAGVLNAVVAGGVVDGQFSSAGLRLRLLFVLPLVSFILAAFDGSVTFALGTVAVFGLLGVLSAVSALHLYLAAGTVEYRLYDDQLVAYDHRLDTPQWAVSYQDICDVTVQRGLFGSPCWLATGTVAFERTDDAEEDTLHSLEPRSSVVFVPNPEDVADLIRSRGGR
jgi:hypothetical protein